MVLAIVLALGPIPSAGAASFVSDPSPHAELDRAPGWVTMAFSFQIDPSTAKVLVLDVSGRNVTTGSLIVEWTNLTTQLRDDLPQGTYTVHYRVSRPDGEPLGGTYQFAFGPGAWSNEGDTTWKGSDKEPEILKDTDPNGAPTAAASATPSSTAPTSSAPASSSSPASPASGTAAPSFEPTTSPGAGSDATGAGQGLPAVIAGLVVLLAAVGGGGVWWFRRRRNQSG